MIALEHPVLHDQQQQQQQQPTPPPQEQEQEQDQEKEKEKEEQHHQNHDHKHEQEKQSPMPTPVAALSAHADHALELAKVPPPLPCPLTRSVTALTCFPSLPRPTPHPPTHPRCQHDNHPLPSVTDALSQASALPPLDLPSSAAVALSSADPNASQVADSADLPMSPPPDATAPAHEPEPTTSETIPTESPPSDAAAAAAAASSSSATGDSGLDAAAAMKRATWTSGSQASLPRAFNRFSTIPSSPSLSSTSRTSRRTSMVPLARRVEDGPPMPISAITSAVRSTNPILEEILHSIKLLNDNDESLVVLDLKDCNMVTLAHGTALADAIAVNTHLKELNLCNAQVATSTASELAATLRTNKSLEILNLESNNIGPLGIKHLAEALAYNDTLLELRLINQKQAAGIDAEQTFARSLQKNETIVKIGLQFRDAASRNAVDRMIMRNKDKARRMRLALAQDKS
ncbi:Tropomodulin-2 [Entophlyctis luteolus]|nr:Tropomodulin-2 [Entophlyctis luteolus]